MEQGKGRTGGSFDDEKDNSVRVSRRGNILKEGRSSSLLSKVVDVKVL